VRCGLEEIRLAGEDARPLVEAHHLSYGDAETAGDATTTTGAEAAGPHEITVALCRWCHTKVHRSIARIDDDASPDPEAIAEREGRRTREREEAAFETARERFDEST
jgi:hypothetical protein